MIIQSSTDEKFFRHFEQQAEMNYKAALYLKDLMDYFKKISLLVKSVSTNEDRKWFIRMIHQIELTRIVHQIRQVKQEGNNLSKEFNSLLTKTLITPIDSDDLYELSMQLLSILQSIHSAANRIELYRAQESDKFSSKIIHILVSMTQESKEAFKILRKMGNVKPHLDKMLSLERKSSEAYIEGMGLLFQSGNEIEIIKWNDIYIRIRNAIRFCTHLSEMIEYLVIKYD